MLTTYEDLVVERHGNVLWVWFNRPDRLNAVRRKSLDELLELLESSASDPEVRVVVFTGRGRAFTAGQDLDELNQLLNADGLHAREQVRSLQSLTRLILEHPKVTIASLNGVAVGFGAELALNCDIRIASTAARIGFPEATRGLFQTNGVTWLLPRVVGHGVAARLLLTGELLDGAEAYRLGLATDLAEPDQLDSRTRELALTIAQNAPVSLRLIKDSFQRVWREDLDAALENEVAGMSACLDTSDLREGTRAFLEKRAPIYEGK